MGRPVASETNPPDPQQQAAEPAADGSHPVEGARRPAAARGLRHATGGTAAEERLCRGLRRHPTMSEMREWPRQQRGTGSAEEADWATKEG